MMHLMAAALVAIVGQDLDARAIVERYEALRPTVKDLAWYQLDWAATLKEARERASREKRPIAALICINVFGNLYTGHC